MPDFSDLYRRIPIQWDDKTLVMQRPSFATEAALREFLEREAIAGITRKRDLFPTDASFQDALRAVSRDIACRVYAWGSVECVRALQSPDVFKELCWLIFTQRDQDGKPSENERLPRRQVDRAFDEVGPAILDAWNRLNSPDPQSPPEQTQPAA